MVLHKAIVRLALLAGVVLLGSCGGGGDETTSVEGAPAPLAAESLPEGPPAPNPHIAFDPPVLSANVRTGDYPIPQTARVFVALGAIESPRLYVYLLSKEQVLETGRFEIWRDTGDRYAVQFPLNPRLPAGTHTGKLTIRICYDSDCAVQHPASGAELPYEIKALPGLTLTVRVDGLPVADGPVRLNSGSVLSMESSEPVGWSDWDFGVSDLVKTDRTWTATIRFVGVPNWEVFANTLATPIASRLFTLHVSP